MPKEGGGWGPCRARVCPGRGPGVGKPLPMAAARAVESTKLGRQTLAGHGFAMGPCLQVWQGHKIILQFVRPCKPLRHAGLPEVLKILLFFS
jgi:hypothetical protein